MSTANRLSDLSPGAAVLIGAAAFAVGIAINVDNAKFFAHGIELIMPDGALRQTRIEAGYLMVIAELFFFFIASMVRGPGSGRWRLAFTVMALSLAAFETVTIYSTQAAIGRAGVAEVTGTDSRIEQLQASIAAHRRNAAALLEAGQHSSQSVIAASRADGARSIRDAAALDAQAQSLSAELDQLHASRRPTMESILGDDGAQAHNAAFAILLMLSGMLLTSSAGWFVGNARLAWAARQLGAAGRWARDGAARVAVPAAVAGSAAMMGTAAHAAPSPAPVARMVPAPTPSSIRYSIMPVAAPAQDRARADTLHCTDASTPAQGNCAHADTVAATECADASTPPQDDRAHADTAAPADCADADTVPAVRAQAKASRSQRRTPRADRVEDGQKIDTGTKGKSAARYLRVRAAVTAGQLKPSVRAIQAAEGGGTVVVRRYLQSLVDEGLIARKANGQGYELQRQPDHPSQHELAL